MKNFMIIAVVLSILSCATLSYADKGDRNIPQNYDGYAMFHQDVETDRLLDG